MKYQDSPLIHLQKLRRPIYFRKLTSQQLHAQLRSNNLGGESIYSGVFVDEFHSRLRFKHRGLVACADAGSPNTNGSQFFITLDRRDWLDKSIPNRKLKLRRKTPSKKLRKVELAFIWSRRSLLPSSPNSPSRSLCKEFLNSSSIYLLLCMKDDALFICCS